MAENDIYNSEQKYKNFVSNGLEQFGVPIKDRKKSIGYHYKYYCKNKSNLEYFRELFKIFDAKDLSFVRRNRLINNFKIVCHVSEKDLKDCNKRDVDAIVGFSNAQLNSLKSRTDLIRDLKYLWKELELDLNVIQHLNTRFSKAKERARNDKLNFEEFQRIISYFKQDIESQAYLMMLYDCLLRPQELLYLKIKDVIFQDDHYIVNLTEHGKEGCRSSFGIDSFPYVARWKEQHPKIKDGEAYFFTGERDTNKQLCLNILNRKLKRCCKALKLNKRITSYSFNRNGISHMLIKGVQTSSIQKRRGWTSLKQLKVYDNTDAMDMLNAELIKRGLRTEKNSNGSDLSKKHESRACVFCGEQNGFSDEFCNNCKRPLDRKKLVEMANMHEFISKDELGKTLLEFEKKFKEKYNY